MPYSTNIIRLLDKVEPPIKEVLIAILEEIEPQRRQWEESVTSAKPSLGKKMWIAFLKEKNFWAQ